MDNSRETGVRFRACIEALFAAFGAEATDARFRGYWLGLQDLPLAGVEQAVASAIRSSKHLPKPAELRRLAGELADDEVAELAWAVVLRSVPLGPYKPVCFQDPHVNATIRHLGGWPTFLSRFRSADEEKWVRLEFLKTYSRLRHAGVNGDVCAALEGLSEASVTRSGLEAPSPVAIACGYTSGSGNHAFLGGRPAGRQDRIGHRQRQPNGQSDG